MAWLHTVQDACDVNAPRVINIVPLSYLFRMTTIVKYFICETDEYEEPQHPNCFRTNKPPDQILLKDIKERFADWKGGFQFYFKTTLDGEENYVWENIADDQQMAPKYKGQILFKAVRTGFKQFFEVKSRDKETVTGAKLQFGGMQKKKSLPSNTPVPRGNTLECWKLMS